MSANLSYVESSLPPLTHSNSTSTSAISMNPTVLPPHGHPSRNSGDRLDHRQGETTFDTLSFSNYSPRYLQACLDSTLMTYLQQPNQRQGGGYRSEQHESALGQGQGHDFVPKSVAVRRSQVLETQQRAVSALAAHVSNHAQRDQTQENPDRLRSHAPTLTTVPHPRPQGLVSPDQPHDHPSHHHQGHQGHPGPSALDLTLPLTLTALGPQEDDDQEDDLESEHEDEYEEETYDSNDQYSDHIANASTSASDQEDEDHAESDYDSSISQPTINVTQHNGRVHSDPTKSVRSPSSDTTLLNLPQHRQENNIVLVRPMHQSSDIKPSIVCNVEQGKISKNPDIRRQATVSGDATESAQEGMLALSLDSLMPAAKVFSPEALPPLPNIGLSPTAAVRLAKARAIPYVEDEQDSDKDSAEYDDEEEGEDEYSYSEDDEDEDEEEDEEEEDDEEDEEEEDESMTEYHYGAREGSRPRTTKGRPSQQGHLSRAIYHHSRPPRLDEHFLQKRAISKQVVRRSSLTALLGEASQPDTSHPQHMFSSFNGQPLRQATAQSRRPALSNVWGEMVGAQDASGLPPPALNPGMDKGTFGPSRMNLPPLQGTARSDASTHQPSAVETSTSAGVNRPRRTDSGVEVKLSPQQDRDSSSNDCQVDDLRQATLPPAPPTVRMFAHSGTTMSGFQTSILPYSAMSARRTRIKSEGDSRDRGSPPAAGSLTKLPRDQGPLEPLPGPSSSRTPGRPCQPILKSSISSHTLPRAAGKRFTGRKHVSWHHSLFPTERVLHVKPSLPSLSSVAVESAAATLSQLPAIPVMAKDNVKEFHQSIRSLRTLSRIEIAKMSYKQQGRQELTSPVPIAKTPQEATPWWNPSRWLKGPVTVDKRHWKPDSSRESCAYCFAPFHRISNPRHHCRKCGDIFCEQCASAEILMDAKNCVYVQQSQLARWSRRVDIQRHSLWVDTLPQLHPVRTAAETALVAGSGAIGVALPDGKLGGLGSLGQATGLSVGLGGVSMGPRSSSSSGNGNGRRGSWQITPALKKSRLSIFGLFGGSPGSAGNTPFTSSDSRRGSVDIVGTDNPYPTHHFGHLSHNPNSITFSAGRRSSTSSVLRNHTVSGVATLGGMGSNDVGIAPIAMSRRMSSGGVGEICLARICVGCERELLKPVKRCNSIAKYHGSLNRRGDQRPGPGYGGPIYTEPPQVDHPVEATMPTQTRRHSPLRPSGCAANGTGMGHPPARRPEVEGGEGHHVVSEAVGPHGEQRLHTSFQDQALHYTLC